MHSMVSSTRATEEIKKVCLGSSPRGHYCHVCLTDGKAVEAVGECLPQFDTVAPLALIIESINPDVESGSKLRDCCQFFLSGFKVKKLGLLQSYM